MSVAMHNPIGEQRRDFLLPALRRLGGSTGVNYCHYDERRGGIQEVQTVFVSCPREAWVREFGEPQHVCHLFDGTCGKWVWSWEHVLPQGRIHCLGQFFQRAAASDWIIVKQLTLHPNGSET